MGKMFSREKNDPKVIKELDRILLLGDERRKEIYTIRCRFRI